MILLHIFIILKIVFNSWNMILKLKSFIQIGTYIIHKKRLTSRVAIKPRPWGIKGTNVDFLPSLSPVAKPFTPSQGVFLYSAVIN